MLTTCTLMNTSTCLQSYLLNYVLLLFNFGALIKLSNFGKKESLCRDKGNKDEEVKTAPVYVNHHLPISQIRSGR